MAITWEYTSSDIKISRVLSTEFSDNLPDDICNCGTTSPYFTNFTKRSKIEQINATNTALKTGCNDYSLSIPSHTIPNVRLYSVCVLTSNTSTTLPQTWTPNSNTATTFRVIDFNPQKHYISYSRYNSAYVDGFVGILKDFSTDSATNINGNTVVICPLLLYTDPETGYTTYVYPYKPHNNPFMYFSCTTGDSKTYEDKFVYQGWDVTTGGTTEAYSIFPESLSLNNTMISYDTSSHCYRTSGIYNLDFDVSGTGFSRRAHCTISYTNAENLSETSKKLMACLGYYFEYNNVKYMPIITNGITDGSYVLYSQKDQYDSDIKTATSTIEGKPDFPEVVKDHIDDMPLGYTGFTNSLVQYFKMDRVKLASLSTALGLIENGIQHVISVKSYAVPTGSYIVTSSDTEITLGSGDSIQHTGVVAEKITSYKFDLAIGSKTVDGYYGNYNNPHFLDFAPYTTLEVYIPYCGIVGLPTHCMYKTINVYLVGDIISGECVGVVKCEGQIVAEKAGMFGYSSAMSTTDNALRDNAIMSSMLSTISGVAGTAMSGTVSGVVQGSLGVMSGVVNSLATINNNYTRIVGSNAGRVQNALPNYCYLIRNRPVSKESDKYRSTYGIPTNKTMSLSGAHGLVIVDNLNTDDITGATAQEREELKSFYNRGVIL